MTGIKKTRNIAKINNISYIKDASLYNSIYQSNNFNDNISIDVPPFFAYWLNYEDLKDGQGNNILHDQWSEEDLYEFTNLDLSDYFNIYNSDNSVCFCTI